MTKQDMVSFISKSLDYCHSHNCMACPKSDACSSIFGNAFIESKVYNLAVRCSKFNNASDDEED